MPYVETDYFCATNNSDVSTGTVIEHTGTMPILDLATFQMDLTAATFEVDNFGSYLFNCQLAPLPAYSATFRGEVFGCGEDDNGEICTSAEPASTEE
jgi:hypothetical protein